MLECVNHACNTHVAPLYGIGVSSYEGESMSRHRMLVCFAHPDDEAFPVGGTLASYTAQGVDVRLICATSGEEGEIRQPGSATRETLPQVRRQELKASCRALGLQEPVLLDHRDSGMQGDEANKHPQAFINVPAEQVVEFLVAEIRRFRPHVVLTFGPDGLYGHPDHCAMSDHATAAFHLAGDPQAFTSQLTDRLGRRGGAILSDTALL